MSTIGFSYETRQQLPATLTSEEWAAVQLAARGARAFLVKSLAWLAAALSHNAATRHV